MCATFVAYSWPQRSEGSFFSSSSSITFLRQLSGRGQKCAIASHRSAVTESIARHSGLARGPGVGTVSTIPQARHTSALPRGQGRWLCTRCRAAGGCGCLRGRKKKEESTAWFCVLISQQRLSPPPLGTSGSPGGLWVHLQSGLITCAPPSDCKVLRQWTAGSHHNSAEAS